MEFEEYEFDVTRLWEALPPEEPDEDAPRLTKRTKPPRDPAADLLPFPRRTRVAPKASFEEGARLALAALLPGPGAGAKSVRRCRKRVSKSIERLRASLGAPGAPPNAAAVAAAAETWLASTCSACGRCGDG